jgi:hypothetical protein
LPGPDDVEIGAALAGGPLRLSLARVLAFSGGPLDEPGWPQRNLHTDIDKAREAGLDHIIASGTQSEGLLITFLIDTFGGAWYGSGNLEVRFLKPVRVGDVVRPGLRWTGKEHGADGLRLTAECWCEIEDGSRVLAGTASCTLPHPRDTASRA